MKSGPSPPAGHPIKKELAETPMTGPVEFGPSKEAPEARLARALRDPSLEGPSTRRTALSGCGVL